MGALPNRSAGEGLIRLGLRLCALTAALVVVGVALVLIGGALDFFGEVSPGDFLGESRWAPGAATPHFGIWPLVAGTLLTSVLALAVALPLGLLGAIYLSEMAEEGTRRVLKPLLELLTGIPTVVFGFLALIVLTPLLQSVIPGVEEMNALSAGLVMGVMITPLIASLSEDALRAVPRSLREASWALGAGELPTIIRVVLPAAASGITGAAILGVARALGETMIVSIAAGTHARLSLDPRVSIETMTAYIVEVSLGDAAVAAVEYRAIFAVALALFTFSLAANFVAHRVQRSRWRSAR